MEAQDALIQAARAMNDLGINQGKSGNISMRDGEGLWLTPSGVAYERMSADDVVFMKMDGSWTCPNADMRPSSEWRFHLDIMKARPDVNAVVHSHPIAATAVACLRRAIPAFHYMVAVAGGKFIPLAQYATFGSEELSHNVLTAMGDLNACLLANHGMIACAPDPETALSIAVEVEALAAQYIKALAVEEPAILDDEEMDRVLAKFNAGYGYASVEG